MFLKLRVYVVVYDTYNAAMHLTPQVCVICCYSHFNKCEVNNVIRVAYVLPTSCFEFIFSNISRS